MQREQIVGVVVEPLGPYMHVPFGVDQLRVDPDSLSEAPDAAFQDIAHIQFAADPANVGRFVAVRRSRCSRDNDHVGDARQVGRDVVGNRLGKIIIGIVAAQVMKRQHDDREPWGARLRRVRGRQRRYRDDRRRQRRDCVGAEREGMQRACDVLGWARPEIDKFERQLVSHLLMNNVRDADAARLGHRFEPRCDVHPVAIDVLGFGNHVTEIDADAEPHALLRGNSEVAVMHAALHLDRAKHGFDDAWKFRQKPVTGILDDAAVVLLDFGIDEFTPMRHQEIVNPLLIGLHETRVARKIGEEDRGESAGRGHGAGVRSLCL